MAVVVDTQFDDVLNTTLRNLPRGKFNDFASKFQHYEAFSRLMKSEGETVVDTADGGQGGFSFDAMTAGNGMGAMVGLADVDDVNFSDGSVKGYIPWRRNKTAWEIERRLSLENKGLAKLYDLVKLKQAQSEVSNADCLEAEFWGGPSGATDLLSLWGMKLWLQLRDAATIASDAAGTTHGGFTSKIPNGFTDIAGVSPTTVARWRNWAAAYTQYTKSDILTRMREAAMYTDFKSPVDVPDFQRGKGNRMRVYADQPSCLAMELIGEGQNENLGRDLAPFQIAADLKDRFGAGSITFRGSPIIPVGQMNPTDIAGNALTWGAHHPVMMINWAWGGVKFLEGDMFRVSSPIMDPLRHNWTRVFTDATLNPYFTDRSRLAIIYQSVNGD
jgi:hypothetical protein